MCFWSIDNNLIEVNCTGTFSVKTNIFNTGEEALEIKIEGSPYSEDDWWIRASFYSKKLIRGFHKIIEE